jgi:hypothetical protein
MDIITLRTFFLWCTIINGIVLLFSSLICFFAPDWAYSMHGRLFNLSRETVNTICYSFIALYKMVWIVFNLVPWIALLIIG